MGKLIGLLVILACVAGAVYYFSAQTGEVEDSQKGNDNKPRLEEKYGYTGQGVGG